jgi:predicted ATP-binding protein involved in virulence
MVELSAPYNREFSLLGVSSIGPPPIGRIDLPLPNGVTVLYGKNGAGKTKVLEMLRQSLSGQEVVDECWVHIRLGTADIDANSSDDVHELLTIALKESLAVEVLRRSEELNAMVMEDVETASARDLVDQWA